MQHSQLIDNTEYTRDEWIARLWISKKEADKVMVTNALDYMLQIASVDREVHMPISLDVANILITLQVDQVTLIAALLSDIRLNETFSINDIEDNFNGSIALIVKNMRWLHNFKSPTSNGVPIPEQAEKLRRMLLAMVDDVRAVLIRLAWNLQQLRLLSKGDDDDARFAYATETIALYSPLASRLGINQLKWEMEDLAFHYLEPDCYKRIAKLLSAKRLEREEYVDDFATKLRELLEKAGIKSTVYGRPKHIYSIWTKMKRKQLEFDQLYDLRAVRVIVETNQDCYSVISSIHEKWTYIKEEFDDYISNRKPNGYQSLHTVVVGPKRKPVEIQIRTKDMHLFAELGVAAHWRYKEEGSQDTDMERVVSSLRRLLESEESDTELLEGFKASAFSDRVFALTPKGEIQDLPKGSTPIDFAYAVHTHVGHLCKGAKVNGSIVSLDYKLRNGDKVEIITGNVEEPKRKWVNPILGYIGSPRTSAKIKHWFRQQNHDKNLQDGMTMLDQEQRRLGIKKIELEPLIKRFTVQSKKEFLIALGRGDISVAQLSESIDIPDKDEVKFRKVRVSEQAKHKGIQIQGVSNLLVEISNCCQPVPGDTIVGYITIGRGIKVHRSDCINVQEKNLTTEQKLRLTDASWGSETTAYTVNLQVTGFNQPGFLRDIADILAKQKINVSNIYSEQGKTDLISVLSIEVQIENVKQLSIALEKIEELSNVMDAKRKS